MDICSAANVSLMIELIFTQRNSCMPSFFGHDKLMKIKLVAPRELISEAERALSGKVL